MPITPSATRRRKPTEDMKLKHNAQEIESDDFTDEDDSDILGKKDDVNPSEYDEADESAKAASAFNITKRKNPAVPAKPSATKTSPPTDPVPDDEDDEDEDMDDIKPRPRPTKSKKSTRGKSKKSGSSGNAKILAGVLAVFLVVSGLGVVTWKFILPILDGGGNTPSGVVTLVAPHEFLDLGTSESLQTSLASMGHTLSSFESSSRTIARASSLSQATSAIVVSNQEALDKHSGSGNKNIAAFNTPLVFAMKQQTANELKEYGIVGTDPADGSLVMDVDKLMVEIARGAPYKLSGPDMLNTDLGNLLWCLMNSSMANSGLDEQVQLAVLNNIRTNFRVETSNTSDTFRSLVNDTGERKVVAVPESAVVVDSGISMETWEDFSQNSLVIAYPRQSAILSFHVVTFDQNGAVWFEELKKLSVETLFNTYGLRPGSLEAPHLGTVRLQAGLKQTVTSDTVMPSVDRFNTLLSMLGS